jgi:hypothetical protein
MRLLAQGQSRQRVSSTRSAGCFHDLCSGRSRMIVVVRRPEGQASAASPLLPSQFRRRTWDVRRCKLRQRSRHLLHERYYFILRPRFADSLPSIMHLRTHFVNT